MSDGNGRWCGLRALEAAVNAPRFALVLMGYENELVIKVKEPGSDLPVQEKWGMARFPATLLGTAEAQSSRQNNDPQ